MEHGHDNAKVSKNAASAHSVNENAPKMHEDSDDDVYATASATPASTTSNHSDSHDKMELDRLINKVKMGLGISSSDNTAADDGSERETAAQYRRRVRRKKADRDISFTHAAHGLRHGNSNTPVSPEHHESSSPSMTLSVMSAGSTVSDSADIDQILSDQEEHFEIHHADGGDGGAKGFRVVRKRRPRSQQVIDEHDAADKVSDELDELFEPTLEKYMRDVSDDEEEDEVKVKSR